MNKKYILGLDIGISSVGWGMLELDEYDNPYKIIDVGSRIFTPGEVEKSGDSRAKERRKKRGARRISRRREFRLDRVRNLLYEKCYLKGKVESNIVSVKNEELSLIFDNMVNTYYKNKDTNPYKLKVEALDRKLTDEELSIILVHYAKKRGYKSNREESTDSDNNSGKVKSAIEENTKIMKDNNYRTVSEMYVKDNKFKNKIKNSPGDYKISVTNEMYLEEINKVLNKQIEFGLIDENFKNEYLNIYNSRRHYSEGPGYYYEYDEKGNKIKKRSPYGGDLIDKMVGKCKFDNEPRAPKRAFSSELYVAITKLVNLKYKINDGIYTSLTKEELNKTIDQAKTKKIVTYKDLTKIIYEIRNLDINSNQIEFNNLSLSKKEYGKLIEELKTKLKIKNNEKVIINDLPDNEKSIYNELYNEKLLNKSLIELTGYHSLRAIIIKQYGVSVWNELKENMNFLDEIALYCTNYKMDEEILKRIKESSNIDSRFEDIQFVKDLPNFKDHLMLSTKIIRRLIPLMIEGNTYDKAMSILNYNHSNAYQNQTKKDLLVPIYVDESITNQRVIRSLTQTRKVINSIIKKYGLPKIINIETARELAKSRQERREIEKSNLEKQVENEKIKNYLVELGLFQDINKISSNDLLKFKLWKEQSEFCGYSMKKINIEDLFKNNTTQIDHILPYSRTYNDNYLNKTLVLTKENQDKGNKTPFEWFGNTAKWEKYTAYINNLTIPQRKKDNYLLKKLDFETEREMREQNLNDTKYISKELSSLIKAYLNVEKVNMYSGTITSKLRARWGFNRLTHSYISNNYRLPNDMKKNTNKDRDNHLHHAMDALVIASITPSLQQKITLYEKYSRYIDGLTKNALDNLNVENAKYFLGEYYDDETGEIKEINIKDYIKEQQIKENIEYNKYNISKLKFPMPYENFSEEAILRVYEQNLETLKSSIENNYELRSKYSKSDIENLHTLTPSIAKSKISGQMHDETYYGIKEIGIEDDKKIYKTLRTPLEKVKRKDLENIPDKLGGSKEIYETLVEWFSEYRTNNEKLNDVTGADVLKHNGNKYPVSKNDKEQKEIKRIKVYSEYKNTGHMIKNSNVEKGSIYKIEVFKSKNKEDNKMYFAAYDILEIKKINTMREKGIINENFKIKLDYGQNKNNKIVLYKELANNYDLYITLNKNDLVKIITKDNKESIAYIVGCSSGMLEVKSKIGDGYDIITNKFNENNIFSKQRSQYQITISTIKEIKKLSISILGEISGL